MTTEKTELLEKIHKSLIRKKEFIIDDIEISRPNGIVDAEKIYLDENNVPMIELENGETFELQECNYDNIFSIFEEVY